ncbi:C45 family autoproteolytic acyltransferase/hydolase [Oricola sp.]|uniref:C45 family autoproteolytic acyltransferase/hydolase n=1 Tax=Oricola sp. TaxID=1979950 RepID=UPI003BAC1355
MNYTCPLIEISGKPHARGVQYGKVARPQIERGVRHYVGQLEKLGFGRHKIHETVRAYLPVMEAYDIDCVDEMRGIAEGAELPLEDIAFLNARTEVVKLGQNPQLREKAGLAGLSDECTSALALPAATRDGTVIQGQNWDWKLECAESTVVLKIRRDDGPDVLTFTEAGGLARSGMNSAGIAITSNYLDCERDYRELGIPLLLTRRKMLEATHLPLVTQIVYGTKRSGSNNIMASHCGGVGYNLECAPDEVFAIFDDDGLITHANHWNAPAAKAKLRDLGIANTPDTLLRDCRVNQILSAERGSITRETFKKAFLDDYQHPYSVCRPPRESTTMAASATVASIIMEPELGIMELAILPALNPEYTTYTLEMSHVAQTKAAAAE